MKDQLEEKIQYHKKLEDNILSKFLTEPELIIEHKIPEKMFLDLKNRKIYKGISEEIDLSIAISKLSQEKELEVKLYELADIENRITAITITVDRFKESFKMIELQKVLNREIDNSEDFEKIIRELKDDIEVIEKDSRKKEIGSYRSGLLIESLFEKIDKKEFRQGVGTGFPKLNSKLGGGLFSGLVVLGAISSLGKTTLAINIAESAARNGNEVLYFSLEMGTEELIAKILSRITCKLDKSKASSALEILKGEYNDETFQTAIIDFQSRVGEKLYITEGGIGYTIEELRNHIERHIASTGNRPVVFIDYLQILRTEKKLSDKERIDYIVTELKRISRDLEITIFTISSLNRANYMETISFESFKESGGIEYTADVVLGLELKKTREIAELKTVTAKREALNEAKNRETREIRLICLKNRNGNSYFEIEYQYIPKYNWFKENII